MQRYILGLLLVLFLNFANANDFAAQVKHAETSHQNGYYFLAADLEYYLSPQSKEALQNGVPLFWHVDVHLNQVRDFWWDKVKLKYSLFMINCIFSVLARSIMSLIRFIYILELNLQFSS